jgi:hypothetical protein
VKEVFACLAIVAMCGVFSRSNEDSFELQEGGTQMQHGFGGIVSPGEIVEGRRVIPGGAIAMSDLALRCRIFCW